MREFECKQTNTPENLIGECFFCFVSSDFESVVSWNAIVQSPSPQRVIKAY